jgi:hypothetical protein
MGYSEAQASGFVMPWLAYVVDGIFIALWSFEFPVFGFNFPFYANFHESKR